MGSNGKKITRDEILHIAQLSRLKLSQSEIEMFYGQIESILDYVSQLQEAQDLDGDHPTSQDAGLKNVTRSDEFSENSPDKAEERTALLDNAPARSGDYFKVRKVIE